VIPVLNILRGHLKIPISIDTNKSEVAEAAAEAGAQIINDVTALQRDPRIAEVARRRKLPLILMHMRGEPRTMQTRPFAQDAMRDVTQSLKKAAALATHNRVPKSQLVLDPGIGFGKSFAQNYELIARLPELARLGFPILVGPSRKGFIGRTLGGAPENERTYGTAAAVTACILQGAHIVRVHDVREMAQVARVADMLASPKLRHARQP
jgi:dihydropteroate synthase